MNNTTPWVEKYRPINFESIVLDNINKHLMNISNYIKKYIRTYQHILKEIKLDSHYIKFYTILLTYIDM